MRRLLLVVLILFNMCGTLLFGMQGRKRSTSIEKLNSMIAECSRQIKEFKEKLQELKPDMMEAKKRLDEHKNNRKKGLEEIRNYTEKKIELRSELLDAEKAISDLEKTDKKKDLEKQEKNVKRLQKKIQNLDIRTEEKNQNLHDEFFDLDKIYDEAFEERIKYETLRMRLNYFIDREKRLKEELYRMEEVISKKGEEQLFAQNVKLDLIEQKMTEKSRELKHDIDKLEGKDNKTREDKSLLRKYKNEHELVIMIRKLTKILQDKNSSEGDINSIFRRICRLFYDVASQEDEGKKEYYFLIIKTFFANDRLKEAVYKMDVETSFFTNVANAYFNSRGRRSKMRNLLPVEKYIFFNLSQFNFENFKARLYSNQSGTYEFRQELIDNVEEWMKEKKE